MLWSFIVATTLICLMPGPSMLVIIARTLDEGLRAGLLATLGATFADAILLVLIMSGLGALLIASPLAFQALKWSGVVYLIWLGWKELRSASTDAGTDAIAPKGSAFVAALGVTLLNPKIIGFLTVYFPQFIVPGRPVMAQMWVLGPLFLAIVLLVFVACALGARAIQSTLRTPRGRRMVSRASGLSLIGCGVLCAAA